MSIYRLAQWIFSWVRGFCECRLTHSSSFASNSRQQYPTTASSRQHTMIRTSVNNTAAIDKRNLSGVIVDGVAEGVVAFPFKPMSSFRYIIKVQADKVSFGLKTAR